MSSSSNISSMSSNSVRTGFFLRTGSAFAWVHVYMREWGTCMCVGMDMLCMCTVHVCTCNTCNNNHYCQRKHKYQISSKNSKSKIEKNYAGRLQCWIIRSIQLNDQALFCSDNQIVCGYHIYRVVWESCIGELIFTLQTTWTKAGGWRQPCNCMVVAIKGHVRKLLLMLQMLMQFWSFGRAFKGLYECLLFLLISCYTF